MALKVLEDKGMPLDRQRFTWRDLVQQPISKLDDDAFTRVRIIWMNGMENDIRLHHPCTLQSPLRLRCTSSSIEHQQATLVNCCSCDHSPLETTIAMNK